MLLKMVSKWLLMRTFTKQANRTKRALSLIATHLISDNEGRWRRSSKNYLQIIYIKKTHVRRLTQDMHELRLTEDMVKPVVPNPSAMVPRAQYSLSGSTGLDHIKSQATSCFKPVSKCLKKHSILPPTNTVGNHWHKQWQDILDQVRSLTDAYLFICCLYSHTFPIHTFIPIYNLLYF